MTTRQLLLNAVTGTVAAVALSGGAQAAITTYTTSAALAAATTLAATDSFNNMAIDFLASPAARNAGPYNYTVSSPGGLYGAGTTADVWLSTSLAGDAVTFAGFSGVSALGGFFFGTDTTGALLGGQTMTVTATDSAGATAMLTLPNATASSFAGFTSTAQLTQVQVSIANTGAWVTANNLTLAIPEPATWSLWLGGLAALGGLSARRMRQAGRAAT